MLSAIVLFAIMLSAFEQREQDNKSDVQPAVPVLILNILAILINLR